VTGGTVSEGGASGVVAGALVVEGVGAPDVEPETVAVAAVGLAVPALGLEVAVASGVTVGVGLG
jgi:hypothetical protein